MKLRDLRLIEAPIEDLSLVGDFSKSSAFRHADDRKLLTNPKAVAKIKAKWANTKFPFVMFMNNTPEGSNSAHHEVGDVSREWLAQKMPKLNAQIAPQLRDDAINIIFNGNYGAERTPMTAWTIAHRFGHALVRYNQGYRTQPQVPEMQEAKRVLIQACQEVLNDYYGGGGRFSAGLEQDSFFIQPDGISRHNTERYYAARAQAEKTLVAFYEKVGTMRSAREGMIRTELEFLLELLAQYLMTGQVRFNPVPRLIKKGRSVYLAFHGSEYDADHANQIMADCASGLEDQFSEVMRAAMGRIFVM